jgi:hypothetical protein
MRRKVRTIAEINANARPIKQCSLILCRMLQKATPKKFSVEGFHALTGKQGA